MNAETAATYRNPWYKPSGHDPEFYRTSAKPVEYRGMMVYRRLPNCHDIVYQGVCVSQRVGWSKALIDRIIAGADMYTPCPVGYKDPR